MTTKKAVIVLRRSTGSQDVSFAAQEADCRRLCEEKGWEVKSIHKDTASGSVSNLSKKNIAISLFFFAFSKLAWLSA